MTISSFSSTTSMSFSDLNVELGKGAETELSMSQAAAGFSGIITNRTSDDTKYLPSAMEIREFYGLTLGEIEAVNFVITRLVKNTAFESWENTEMIECAERVVPTGESGYTINDTTIAATPQAGPAADLQDGDHLYTGHTGGVNNGTDFPVPSTGDGFVMSEQTDQIFKVATISSDTEVNTPVLDRKPAQRTTEVYEGSLTANRYGKTNSVIVISSAGDTRVTRTIRTQRDSGNDITGTADNVGGSVSAGAFSNDFFGGDTADSNRTNYAVFTGLSADTSYDFRSRGENAFANGDYSTITAKTYKNTSISITEGADGGDGDGTAGTETLDYLTVSVTNTNGTHTPFTNESDITFPLLRVDNTGNVKYRQSTTTSFSGDFVTPSTATYGQALTLNGSGVVYIQPQVITSAGFSSFTRTFEVVDGHISSSFQIGENPGPASISNDGTDVLHEGSIGDSFTYYSDVITINVSNYVGTTGTISYSAANPSSQTGTGAYQALHYRVASSASDKLTSGGVGGFDGHNNSGAVSANIAINTTDNKIYLQFLGTIATNHAGTQWSIRTVTVGITGGDGGTPTTSFSAGTIAQIEGLCIHESMLVDTPNGLIPIDELNIGDLVKSYNSESDIIEDVPIKEIIKPMHKNLYKVNDLILTEDHPIFDENKKLLSISPELSKERYGLDANKLEVGHKLKTLNNEELVVNNITRYDGEHQTYTILTKNNNFFVEGILVHSEI